MNVGQYYYKNYPPSQQNNSGDASANEEPEKEPGELSEMLAPAGMELLGGERPRPMNSIT